MPHPVFVTLLIFRNGQISAIYLNIDKDVVVHPSILKNMWIWNVKILFIVFIHPLKVFSNFRIPQNNPTLPTDFTKNSKMKRNMCNAKGNK
jgi:hypothetical protein